jgi:enoyl-CoA hydratase/carnithine racemase
MEYFQLERTDDGVTVATVDKPPANTLDFSLYDELTLLLENLEKDDATRAVLFASAHPRVFISGADIKDMESYDRTRGPMARRVDKVQGTFLRLQRFGKPTVGAITGHALGGGCEFSLCLDFRVMMAGGPTIGLPEVNLGLVPGGGGTQRLARLVGRSRALEMLMLGIRLTADEAHDAGLVTAVGRDADDTMRQALDLARHLAGQAPVALRLIKQAVNEGADGDLVRGLGVEREAVIEALLSEDSREGVAAFIEKRPPEFKGR